MKVVQKKLVGDRILVEATASVADVEKAFDWASIAVLQQMGVQPEQGKPYAQQAEEHLGVPNLDALVMPRVPEFLVPFAIEKKGIMPAFPPTPAAQTALNRGSEFTFTMEILPKPEFELESYEPVEFTAKAFSLNPQEVEEQMRQTALGFATYEAIEARPVKMHDYVKIAIADTKQDGEPLEVFNTEGRTYPMGEGYMPTGFDMALLGMEPGQSKEVSFDAPADEGTAKVTCTVTVLELQEQVIPEINDEWIAKNMPFFRDAKAFRESIEYQLERMHRAEYDSYLEGLALTQLTKRFNGRIDDAIYEAMRDTQLRQMSTELQQQGISLDQFIQQNGGQQQFGMMLLVQTRMVLVNGYSLDAVFRHEKLTLTDEDIMEACALINPQNPQLARQQMEDMGNAFALREMAERRKATKWVVEHAKITYED